MKHVKHAAAGWTALMVLLACCYMPCHAEQGKVGYAVRAQLPENQISGEVSYFYLNVYPGQEQTLKVLVLNKSDEDIDVELQANTAFTNQNGLIEYTHSEQRDESLAVAFAELVTIAEPILAVPANGSATAEFALKLPDEPFDGEVLGGLLFTKLPSRQHDGAENEDTSDDEAEAEVNAGGMAIKNVFMYCIAVRLKQSDESITPEFELTHAKMAKTAGFPALELSIRNPRPMIVKGAEMNVWVYTSDREPVISIESRKISMAPNSSAPYKILLAGEQALKVGDYLVEVELNHDNATWQFGAPFSVTKAGK